MITDMTVTIVGQVGRASYRLIHISQAAKIYPFHHDTIRKMCNQGEIIATKLGRDWFVSEELIRTDTLTGMLDPP